MWQIICVYAPVPAKSIFWCTGYWSLWSYWLYLGCTNLLEHKPSRTKTFAITNIARTYFRKAQTFATTNFCTQKLSWAQTFASTKFYEYKSSRVQTVASTNLYEHKPLHRTKLPEHKLPQSQTFANWRKTRMFTHTKYSKYSIVRKICHN